MFQYSALKIGPPVHIYIVFLVNLELLLFMYLGIFRYLQPKTSRSISSLVQVVLHIFHLLLNMQEANAVVGHGLAD